MYDLAKGKNQKSFKEWGLYKYKLYITIAIEYNNKNGYFGRNKESRTKVPSSGDREIL